MGSQLLRLENINLTLENFHLNNINIDLYENEIHVVMGENGSGKSLIMQIISGLLPPDAGSIYIHGDLMKSRAFSSDIFDDVIYIQQDATMLNQLTIAENLYFKNMPYKNRLFRSIDYDKLNYMCKQLIDETCRKGKG